MASLIEQLDAVDLSALTQKIQAAQQTVGAGGAASVRGLDPRDLLGELGELLKAPVYGRGDLNEGGEHRTRRQFEGRLKALAKRKSEVMKDLRQQELSLARIEGAELECKYWIGQTPEGGAQQAMLARMNEHGRSIVEAKGAGGLTGELGGKLSHPTGDLADAI